MDSKSILVLGGGVAGLVAANELRRRLSDEQRIVLVEKSEEHAFAASFLWNMVGDRTPERITRPVSNMVRPGVEVIHAEARGIDIQNGRVEMDSQTVEYDYLVVALGANLAPGMIPGLAESAQTFYTLDGSVKLRETLEGFSGGTVSIVVAAKPYKCPGAPYEGAMLIADFFRKRGLEDKVDVHLYSFEPLPMPVAGAELGNAVVEMLEAKGGGLSSPASIDSC